MNCIPCERCKFRLANAGCSVFSFRKLNCIHGHDGTMPESQATATRERIEVIDAEIESLTAQRKILKDALVEHMAPLKPGDVIEWGERKHRGRVVQAYCPCGAEFRYHVVGLGKDGREGGGTIVHAWDRPAKVKDGTP